MDNFFCSFKLLLDNIAKTIRNPMKIAIFDKFFKRNCDIVTIIISLQEEHGMVRKGFKMKLYPDMAEEYEKRHNELWLEMKDMIHEYGGRNYTIFLDRATNVLYGYIEVEDLQKWDKGADTAINRKWWDFMADIMETHPDNSPVCTDLHEVFHLD